MKYLPFLIVVAVFLNGISVAEEPQPDLLVNSILQAEQDVQTSTDELNELRAQIAAERKPLSRELTALQKDVARMRREAEHLYAIRVQSEEQRMNLLSDTEALNEECEFILALFQEYRRALEMRATSAEVALIADKLAAVDDGLSANDNFKQFPQAVDTLLGVVTEWNGDRLGGFSFRGSALDDMGVEHAGTFVAVGPLCYFAAKDHGPAGLAVTEPGLAEPVIYERLEGNISALVKQIADGEERVVPLDVTSGDALKVAKVRVSLLEHAKKGGFVMFPLLLVGAVALVLSVWKTIDLARVRVRGGEQYREVLNLIKTGDIDGAKQEAQTLHEPLASLVAEGIQHRNSPRDHLEEIMHEQVLRSVPGLERHLGTLAVLGGIAPLLGLLGTVTGMIHTFQLVTVFGSGDAKLLSGGISEALVTTEFGLVIAIPILLTHAFLARRSRTVVGVLEQTAVSMVNELKIRAKII